MRQPWTSPTSRRWCVRATAESRGQRRSCCAPAADILLRAPSADEDQHALSAIPMRNCGAVPEGANLGLGCGNPQAIAALKPGEVVIDLGSGAGFDCLLAAPGRARGPRDRRRYDARDDQARRVTTPQGRRHQCRVPARRARAPANRRRHRRRDHLQLRDQPGARQGAGVPRGVPRAEAGWAAGDPDVVNITPLPPELAFRSGAAVQLRLRRDFRRTDRKIAARSRLCRCDHRSEAGEPRERRRLGAGRGIENCVASAMVEARKPIRAIG